MNPDAIHQPQTKHDHQNKRTAIANQRQWDTGDWKHGNRHSHVLEYVSEDKRRDPDHEKHPQLVAGEKSNKKTSHQQQGKRSYESDPADKTPLLADSRKNVIVMHRRGGQKTELDLRVGRLESLSRPTA